jgi:hypothetical protein
MLLTTAGIATIVANPHGTTVEGGMGRRSKQRG